MDFSYVPYLAQALRKGREQYPVASTVIGVVPGLGSVDAVADMAAPDATMGERISGAAGFIPGGKLVGKAAGPVMSSMSGKVVDFLRKKTPKYVSSKRIALPQGADVEAKELASEVGGFTHEQPLSQGGVLAELLSSPYLRKEEVEKRLRELPDSVRFQINALRNSPKFEQARRLMDKLGKKMHNAQEMALGAPREIADAYEDVKGRAYGRSLAVENYLEEKLRPIIEQLRKK